jgi:tRNA G18 (ribose-2'-O)-methylase SpoU
MSAFGADNPPVGAGLELLLYNLQSPINIGMILRVAETYNFGVSIYDSHCVLDAEEKLQTIRDFACGAVTRRGFRRLSDQAAVEVAFAGRRLVSTSIETRARALPGFRFRPGDVVALGNEYDGLPVAMLASADEILHIPMPQGFVPKPVSRTPIDPARTQPVARDGQPNLNVAMAAGILCYAAFVGGLEANRNAAASGAAVI